MQVNSFKAILAAVSVAAFASACTSRHSEVSGVSAAVCPAGSSVKLNPAQLALTKEIQKFEPCFDVTKTFLSGKIGGLTIDSIGRANAGSDDIDQGSDDGTFKLRGSLVLRAPFTTYTFESDVVTTADLRGGKVFNVNIQDPNNKLEAELGGLLDIRARCMDSACKSVSMWMQSYQLGRINSAGVIFSAEATGAYAVASSQQDMIVSVARFNDLMTRSNRGDKDGVAEPVAHDTATFPTPVM